MLIAVVYSFIYGLVVVLMFDPEVSQYLSLLGSEPLSFIWGSIQLIGEPAVAGVLVPFLVVTAIFMLIGFAINVLTVGASIQVALDDYTGQVGTLPRGISGATSRFFTLLIVFLIVSSINSVFLIPLGELAVAMLLAPTPDAMLEASGPFMLLGIVLLFVIALLYPSSAVVIGEDRDPISSLGRTVSLTKSSYLHTLGGIILFYVVMVVIQLVIELGLGMFLGGTISLIISPFANMLIVTPLTYIYQAVLFKDLAARKGQTSQEYW